MHVPSGLVEHHFPSNGPHAKATTGRKMASSNPIVLPVVMFSFIAFTFVVYFFCASASNTTRRTETK